MTLKLLCPARDRNLLLLGLNKLHPKSYLSLPAALLEASVEAVTCESLLLPDSTTVAGWASEFLSQQQFAVLFGCVCLELLSYPAVSPIPSSSALSSTCVLPPPGFAFLQYSPMMRLPELHGSSDSTQMLWSVLPHAHESLQRKPGFPDFFIFSTDSWFGEDADVSHLASASLYPLADAWQHQCLFAASHQMYWWMSCLQQCCLWSFSKPFYCGKQIYSQFLSTSGCAVAIEWFLNLFIFHFCLEQLEELELLLGPTGIDQFISRDPAKKHENFRNILKFNQAKSIQIN